ncbi:type II toxin-antitoxin system RelE/ParE family toxin [Frigoribacterium sp. PvP032]|uniref:type II toxin-antitoxin system RelE/ParE family toxin n=1 Tax=Frigoribacterium sp. PvP032 TaxID=2806589 RepID=UPI001AE824E7|nr:type II toxin-antitoxin system RelE/ParE family toxin [Frigoribacterium sp. PvP032]MBP1189142.1 proteic killer suppression protein [Frigoribacterium sp. PvP032]
MIQSFSDTETEKVWRRVHSKRLGLDLQRAAHRKLLMLDAAEVLDDLRVPPGNRLELLRGDRSGQHSVRVNDQWRICFAWGPAGPADVHLADYH